MQHLEESQRHYAEWKKLDSKDGIIPFIWYSRKEKTIGTENRWKIFQELEVQERLTTKVQHDCIFEDDRTVLYLDRGGYMTFCIRQNS